ncbi:extracellular solute-binding protein [Eubacteriales bacterium OttesenSCG-928-N13]|nr:extracellular solute-binding protein [Eubacteriales bacterium OttesenSCG-928-N13]
MKRLLSLLIACVMVLSLASVAVAEGQTELRMVWWGSDSRHEKTLAVIDLFEAANPDIKVVPEYMGSDSYWDKLATQVAGGNAPDVIQFGGNYPDYVNKGVLQPLNDFFGNQIDITNIDQGVLDSATMADSTYGLCLGTNMLGIAYNKTVLDATGVEMVAPGASWEELEAYMEAVAPLLPEGMYPMTDNSGNNTNYLGYYSRQHGKNMYTNEGVSKIDTALLKDFFDLWASWREKGLIPGAETTAEYSEDGVDNSSLIAGKVAMTLLYSNQLVGFQAATEDELAIMPLPDMEKNAAWVMPSQYFCINSKSDVQDAAARFVNFFVNDPEAGKILGNDRGISASSVVREAIAAQATPVDQKIYDLYAAAAAHTTAMDPNVPNDQEYNDGFKRISQEVAFGMKDTETAANEAYDFLQEMINKG